VDGEKDTGRGSMTGPDGILQLDVLDLHYTLNRSHKKRDI